MNRLLPFSLSLLKILFLLLLASLTYGQKIEAGKFATQLPIHSQMAVVGGHALHFVESGKGPSLLFLHGLGGSSKDWSANLPALAPFYQVIAIDFPGFGESEKPEVEYTIEWLTHMVEKFLQWRKLETIHVVGHSMGGLVALNLAARPDSRVKKIIVADVVGVGDKADFVSYALTRKILGPETRWESLEGAVREELKSMIESFIKEQKPKTAREFFESLPKFPFTGKPFLPMTPAVQMTASVIDFDIRPKLPSIRQPTLILWGEKDPVAPPKDAHLLQGGISSSTLIFFPNCGHSPMMEQPQRFNEEVKKFLQATDSGSSK